MIVKDELKNDWEKVVKVNSEDAYGKGTIDYMIKWADLMEEEIKNNGKLSKTKAEKLSDADTVGITGFMYDVSRKYLGHFWYYGDTLEKLLGNEMTSIIEIREIK